MAILPSFFETIVEGSCHALDHESGDGDINDDLSNVNDQSELSDVFLRV